MSAVNTVHSHSGHLPPAIVLLGPTASGKTAATLALADHLPVEVVSIDSANVYRHLDIGSAKPDAAMRARVPHHLIDLIEPTESYSAARFVQDATAAMRDIVARGRVPLLAGGTMLYYRALTRGLHELPQADPAVRARIEDEAARMGWPAMHAKLALIDPATATRLQPNDAQRIERALEVAELTGRTMSAVLAEAPPAPPELPCRLAALALLPADRAVLHARIARRFDQMLADGLIDEVAGLRRRYALTADLPSMRAVGYRQAWQFLEGEIDRTALRDQGVAATRQLARRQLTWLRSLPEVAPIDSLATDLPQRVLGCARRLLDGQPLAKI